MAKLRKKFIKTPIEEDSLLTNEALTARLDGIVERQKTMKLYKLKGSPLFLWSKNREDEYSLRYYHSYKTDMCDTMMTIHVTKGMEHCRTEGFIHKPAGIWGTFWGVVASLFIDFIVLSYCLLFVAGFNLYNGLAVSAAAIVVRIFICLSLLEINRDRMKLLKTELLRVINTNEEVWEKENAVRAADEEEKE